MAPNSPQSPRRFRPFRALDDTLLSAPRWLRAVVLSATVAWMVWVSLPNVPREYADLSRLPGLRAVRQQPSYGSDTISDMYGAKVVLHDVRDMYTKRQLAQTAVEARTWTKEASAPYPPVALLTEAALFRFGTWTGIGFYGCILALAVGFIGLSLWYFTRTRWYLFPLLYANFTYFSHRFVAVQDDTYLIMLTAAMIALLLARSQRQGCHAAVALAATIKLSPLYHISHILDMPRRQAVLFVTLLTAGLVLPCFLLDNYLDIYRYANTLKGSSATTASAFLLAIPFATVLRYVEVRRGFDLEDSVGWGFVPVALFLALKMNVARHLLIVLLIPDKRARRNVAAAVGLAVSALWPSVFRHSASLWVATFMLAAVLGLFLREIGWRVVRDDLRDLRGTAALLLRPGRHPAPVPLRPRVIPQT